MNAAANGSVGNAPRIPWKGEPTNERARRMRGAREKMTYSEEEREEKAPSPSASAVDPDDCPSLDCAARGGDGRAAARAEDVDDAPHRHWGRAIAPAGVRLSRQGRAKTFCRPPRRRPAADHKQRRATAVDHNRRRSAITTSVLHEDFVDQIFDLELVTRVKDWIRSFRDLDPRFQILEFFNDLSLDGVENFCSRGCRTKGSVHMPRMLRIFIKSGIFSVWRPTSPDAISKMISGEGTGKGLDIKGKSAKCGRWSGFVPYLQIHDNDHKRKVGHMTEDRRVRVFYPNRSYRDIAAGALANQSKTMMDRVERAEDIIQEAYKSRRAMGTLGSVTEDDDEEGEQCQPALNVTQTVDEALAELDRYLMDDPSVHKIDDYACTQGVYGLDVPEKLFWESYVVPNDISRPKGSEYDTGRPSVPEFQQMNNETLRNWFNKSHSDDDHENEHDIAGEGGTESANPVADPRPVLWHAGCGSVGEDTPKGCDPLCPLGLLMAYEENDKVTPVVSDFDCFLVGTRGVKYHEPFGARELSMLSLCVDDIEGILSTPKEGHCWTTRWLEVKKKHAEDETCCHQMPKFGYADPLSYGMMTGAVHHLKCNGAVRHGPESFNYGFPQELDDYYLVISDTFPGLPWRYTNGEELIDCLCDKIDEGYTFPLNPKWILCDPGWKKVYDKLLASKKPNVQSSLDIWYPDEIRRRMNEISNRFPKGFVCSKEDSFGMSRSDRFLLAQLELDKYKDELSYTQRHTAGSTSVHRESGHSLSRSSELLNVRRRARATIL